MRKGKVYLVGAGPGDYRLISLKGAQCISAADVIVYDRLADSRILRDAPSSVELVYAGKAASDHAMRQEDINQLLVDKALEGKTVVRLKGGDPFVFGRGGEEALKLQAHGILFEVVPGITSAISVPAYAGIPVTHRGISASFTVVTGHEDPDKPGSSICWERLATGADTLIFLMGVENLPHITAKLIANGRPAATPAAVIRWGTKPEQQTLVTTVGQAAADVAEQGIKPPAIFIVGEVVNLRDQLAWFDKRPLFGKKILVTRAREQASLLIDQLEDLGAECLEAPAIKIVPPASFAALDESIARLATYQWLIFTSVNGVDYFYRRLRVAGLDSRALGSLKIAAIGSQTAEHLERQGIIADIVPLEFRAEGIVAALEGRFQPGDKILIARAAAARDILPTQLAAAGAVVEVVEAYRTEIGDVDGAFLTEKLGAGEIDLITFTSSSTVTNLLGILGPQGVPLLSRVKSACIGPITAMTCQEYGIRPDIIADEYTIKGLVEAIVTLYAEGEGR